MKVTLTSLLASLLMSAAAVPPAAQGISTIDRLPNAVWEKTFRSVTSEYEYLDVAASGDVAWLLVGVRPRGQLGGDQKYELWRLDPRGERLVEVALPMFAPVSDKSDDTYSTVYGMTILSNGSAAVLLPSSRGVGYLVIDTTGTVVSHHTIRLLTTNPLISRVETSNGAVLAVGRQGVDGWILKLRATGEVVTSLVVPGAPVLLDAVETPEGYVAVGQSIRGSVADVWIGRIGATGQIGSSRSFAGVNPDFTSDGRGGFVLAYYTNAQKGRNGVIQGVDSALAPTWSVTLPDVVSGMRQPALVSTANADVVLAAEGPASVPLIYRLTAVGNAAWRYEHREAAVKANRVGRSGTTRWGRDALIVMTLAVVEQVGETYEQRQVLRLFRLSDG